MAPKHELLPASAHRAPLTVHEVVRFGSRASPARRLWHQRSSGHICCGIGPQQQGPQPQGPSQYQATALAAAAQPQLDDLSADDAMCVASGLDSVQCFGGQDAATSSEVFPAARAAASTSSIGASLDDAPAVLAAITSTALLISPFAFWGESHRSTSPSVRGVVEARPPQAAAPARLCG